MRRIRFPYEVLGVFIWVSFSGRTVSSNLTNRRSIRRAHAVSIELMSCSIVCYMITCKRCMRECDGTFGSGLFCSRACANARNHSVETKRKTSESLLGTQVNKTCPICNAEFSVSIGRSDRRRYCSNACRGKSWAVTPEKFSPRRIRRSLAKLNAHKCLSCGWDRTSCDIHHIRGRKIENPDACTNMTLLCPNCHRLVHERKLDIMTVKTLATHLQESGLSHLVA